MIRVQANRVQAVYVNPAKAQRRKKFRSIIRAALKFTVEAIVVGAVVVACVAALALFLSFDPSYT